MIQFSFNSITLQNARIAEHKSKETLGLCHAKAPNANIQSLPRNFAHKNSLPIKEMGAQ